MLVRGGAELASWPLPVPDVPTLALVDALARLQLTARRLGCSVGLRGDCGRLAGLIRLAGLGEVLMEGSVVEAGGEPEDLEEPGVEEVVVPDDPVP